MAGKSILVVDDSQVVRAMTRNLLEGIGYEVAEASNGRDALRIMQAHSFSAVLLDLEMDVMNGFRCAETIRKWEGDLDGVDQTKQEIIAFTSHTSPKDLELLQGVGIRHVVSKPVDPTQLLGLLNDITCDH